MASNAQCVGKDNIIQMFSNRGIDGWSIWVGKQLLFTGIGPGDLEQMLTMMEDGGNPMYTLRVHRDVTNESEINDKTPAAGSFNFLLHSLRSKRNEDTEEGGYTRGRSSMGAVQRVIEDHIAKKVSAMLEEKEEKYENKLGMLGEILDHPTLGAIFEKVALHYLTPGQTTPPVPIQTQMRAVGSIATDTDLVATLEKLKQYDPEITDHLKKLLRLAESSPDTFKIILASLDKITL
jgi:hypothetical protein